MKVCAENGSGNLKGLFDVDDADAKGSNCENYLTKTAHKRNKN